MSRTTARRLTALARRKADFIEPMDCAPVTKLADGPGWIYEIKLDGYRAIAVKTDGCVNLFSRRKKSFNHHYPLIVEALAELPDGTVVDGEVVALDESGRPNFNLLQNFRSEASHIHYFIFDLLICNDRDLTRLPLSERRKLMISVLKLRPGRLRLVELGSMNEGCLPCLRLQRGAAFQQTPFPIWRRKGRIRAHAINDRNQFLFEDPGPNPPKKHARKDSRSHHSSLAKLVS